MNIGKKFLIGLVMVSLAFVTVAGISFAAEDKSTSNPATSFVNGCRGFFGGAAEELSKLLGLKAEEILEQRNSGKSLADIAKDQGVAEDKVVSTMLEAKKELLDERVKAGVITQEQADLMLERMQSRITERIQNPAAGSGCGGGGCGMGGQGAGGGCGMGGPGARGDFGPGAGYRGAQPATPSTSI